MVLETKAQVEYKSATKRSIRLDIKAVDRNQEHFDVETPVGRLMHDFYCTKSEDMYSKVLADEVKYLKETEGGRGRMCRVLDEMCEEVAKEKAKETARMLLGLNKLSHEEISESTGIPIEVVEELAAQKTA